MRFKGLPEDGDIEGYSKAYQQLFANQLRPLTLLAFLLKSDQDVSELN